MSEAQAIAALVLGYALQWAKGFERVPTWAAQLIVAVLCGACYWAFVGAPQAGGVRDWLVEVAKWSFAAIGVASVAGHAGVAPRTDSIRK